MTFDDLVHEERIRQDDKWGIQNHNPFIWLAILGEEVGELNKAILEDKFGGMQEENIQKEIIQIAAVTKAMWECGQRNLWWES